MSHHTNTETHHHVTPNNYSNAHHITPHNRNTPPRHTTLLSNIQHTTMPTTTLTPHHYSKRQQPTTSHNSTRVTPNTPLQSQTAHQCIACIVHTSPHCTQYARLLHLRAISIGCSIAVYVAADHWLCIHLSEI